MGAGLRDAEGRGQARPGRGGPGRGGRGRGGGVSRYRRSREAPVRAGGAGKACGSRCRWGRPARSVPAPISVPVPVQIPVGGGRSRPPRPARADPAPPLPPLRPRRALRRRQATPFSPALIGRRWPHVPGRSRLSAPAPPPHLRRAATGDWPTGRRARSGADVIRRGVGRSSAAFRPIASRRPVDFHQSAGAVGGAPREVGAAGWSRSRRHFVAVTVPARGSAVPR